jgi:hypothetical protein
MSWDQIAGLLRNLLTFVGGYVVARGWINAEQLSTIVGALVGLAGVGWSIKSNTKASIINSATNMTEVDSSKLQDAISGQALKDAAKPA